MLASHAPYINAEKAYHELLSVTESTMSVFEPVAMYAKYVPRQCKYRASCLIEVRNVATSVSESVLAVQFKALRSQTQVILGNVHVDDRDYDDDRNIGRRT